MTEEKKKTLKVWITASAGMRAKRKLNKFPRNFLIFVILACPESKIINPLSPPLEGGL